MEAVVHGLSEDPRAAEYEQLLRIHGQLWPCPTREVLLKITPKLGLHGEENELKAALHTKIIDAWQKAVDEGLPTALCWWIPLVKEARVRLQRAHPDGHEDLVRRLQLVEEVQSSSTLKKERTAAAEAAGQTAKNTAASWKGGGASLQVTLPEWCDRPAQNRKRKTPPDVLHYNLAHQVLLEVDAILAPEKSVPSSATTHVVKLHFWNLCSHPGHRRKAPYPEHLESQHPGNGVFVAHQLLRQLALIELTDGDCCSLPIKHADLLAKIAERRAQETCSGLDALGDVQKAAVERLLEYSQDERRGYANARFLDLKKPDALQIMVDNLVSTCEQQGVQLTTWVKPNILATLAVYYNKFVREDKTKPKNGLARWCWGLKPYIPGSDIKSKDHLASQCLPQHYDSTGAPVLDAEERSGQAIFSAPVTCKLCHKGFAGHDKLARHCRKEHGNHAEYRKRVFYMAREDGQRPLLPWVERNVVQSFQFFRS